MSRTSRRAGTKNKLDPITNKKFVSWKGRMFGRARKRRKGE